MEGTIKKINGAYPVTRAEAVYLGDGYTLADFLPLYGKSWVTLGDSITAGNGGTPYQVQIGEKWSMAITNLGQSGAMVTPVNGIPIDCPDADFITFWGGINDFKASSGVTLGDMSSPKTRGDTFYGALHYICRTLIEAHPTAKIGFITPMRCVYHEIDEDHQANGRGETLEQYVKAVKEVCAYYGIPVLDMYSENNMSPYITATKTAYYTDGLHPNTAGYARIANRIEKFLMAL